MLVYKSMLVSVVRACVELCRLFHGEILLIITAEFLAEFLAEKLALTRLQEQHT